MQAFQPRTIAESELPGTANSFISSLLPVILLVITTAIPYLVTLDGNARIGVQFMGDSVIVMFVSLLVATYTLGIANGKKIKDIMTLYGESVKDVALILLIVAGAGAFKEILVASKVDKSIGAMLEGLSINPLVLGWMIAALIRVCLGSATVAGLTAAGIIYPVIKSSGVDPNLMILSIGAGSLMFSHVNDSGFWLFKEYFNLSIKDTIRSWSLMETIVSIVGLLGVLILDIFI